MLQFVDYCMTVKTSPSVETCAGSAKLIVEYCDKKGDIPLCSHEKLQHILTNTPVKLNEPLEQYTIFMLDSIGYCGLELFNDEATKNGCIELKKGFQDSCKEHPEIPACSDPRLKEMTN